MITLLGENLASQPPTQAELAQWAATFGLNHPVVADPNWGVTGRFVSGSFGLPAMHLLGAGAQVLQRQTFIDENEVIAALPAP